MFGIRKPLQCILPTLKCIFIHILEERKRLSYRPNIWYMHPSCLHTYRFFRYCLTSIVSCQTTTDVWITVRLTSFLNVSWEWVVSPLWCCYGGPLSVSCKQICIMTIIILYKIMHILHWIMKTVAIYGYIFIYTYMFYLLI